MRMRPKMSEDEARRYVEDWRAQNPDIVNAWGKSQEVWDDDALIRPDEPLRHDEVPKLGYGFEPGENDMNLVVPFMIFCVAAVVVALIGYFVVL